MRRHHILQVLLLPALTGALALFGPEAAASGSAESFLLGASEAAVAPAADKPVARPTPRRLRTFSPKGGGCTISWDNGGGDGLWQNRFNWTEDRLPGPDDDACIGSGIPFVRLSGGGNRAIRSLRSGGPLEVTCCGLAIAAASMIDGPITMTAGELAFFADSRLNGTFTLSGGTLTVFAPATLTLAGDFQWMGGILNETGVINVNGGMSISGGGHKFLDRCTLNNAGTANWMGEGDIFIGDGAVLNTLVTGSFTAQNEQVIRSNGGAAVSVNNAGTFTKSAGTGTAFVLVPFNNDGTVVVQTGRLSLAAGGTSTGVFTTVAGTSVDFTGGTHNLDGARVTGLSSGLLDDCRVAAEYAGGIP